MMFVLPRTSELLLFLLKLHTKLALKKTLQILLPETLVLLLAQVFAPSMELAKLMELVFVLVDMEDLIALNKRAIDVTLQLGPLDLLL
jgi:hypothetical protein